MSVLSLSILIPPHSIAPTQPLISRVIGVRGFNVKIEDSEEHRVSEPASHLPFPPADVDPAEKSARGCFKAQSPWISARVVQTYSVMSITRSFG
ncbi:hypothetical protein GJ744_008638 [Endocarpon pusillum]|uniref:Uncharacterized protein n=1 Tax=Endocarpon pusillum TaxID=364733 RepID=A0A8H7AKM8_9EURO|nr:hypothetical protein GJ744_008638 [Endocarpon pusillum]